MKCENLECVEENAFKFLSNILSKEVKLNIEIIPLPSFIKSDLDESKNKIYINLVILDNLYKEWNGNYEFISTYLFILIILTYLIKIGMKINDIKNILLKNFGENSIEILMFNYIINNIR
jgi:hypothetical protein